MTQYRSVFLKSSKMPHGTPGQERQLYFVFNKMSEGLTYFIRDNDRIIQNNRSIQSTGQNVLYITCDTYLPSTDSPDGSRPKVTRYHKSSLNQILIIGTINIALAVVMYTNVIYNG